MGSISMYVQTLKGSWFDFGVPFRESSVKLGAIRPPFAKRYAAFWPSMTARTRPFTSSQRARGTTPHKTCTTLDVDMVIR